MMLSRRSRVICLFLLTHIDAAGELGIRNMMNEESRSAASENDNNKKSLVSGAYLRGAAK
jgi:hypothetical protein